MQLVRGRARGLAVAETSNTPSMSRRPSIDTISTYQTRDYRYGYGYASQNGSFYSGSVDSMSR